MEVYVSLYSCWLAIGNFRWSWALRLRDCSIYVTSHFKLLWHLHKDVQNCMCSQVTWWLCDSPAPLHGTPSPLWDMPTARHFWKRQYWHLLRFFFWILQRRSHLSYSSFRRIVRRKKPWRNEEKKQYYTQCQPVMLIPIVLKQSLTK